MSNHIGALAGAVDADGAPLVVLAMLATRLRLPLRVVEVSAPVHTGGAPLAAVFG